MRIKVYFVFMCACMLISAFVLSCKSNKLVSAAQAHASDSIVVAFYNVENLYDPLDGIEKGDEDFTPSGKYAWTQERYNLKLQHIAQVYDEMPGALPVFIGMAEIENRSVLEDLVKESKLKEGNYGIIHRNSPDERGIDVAAIYNQKVVSIKSYDYHQVILPDTSDRTREFLHVSAEVKGEPVHFFVNHWPSRRSGQVESESSRVAAAKAVRSVIDSVLSQDANAKILIMGDFNDYPVDKSITEGLGAGVNASDKMYNFMYDFHVAGKGSYYFKGQWGALDQFIATKSVLGKSGWHCTASSAHFFDNDLFMFRDEKGISRPNRTYVGEEYKAGYSDHLSIYLVLKQD